MKNCVFTIVAKNYIGLAEILGESLKENNANTDFYIIVADYFSEDFDIEKLPSNILVAKNMLNISSQQWVDMSFKYDLTEFCTSIKPASFSYFIEKTNYEKIIYLDPDIYIYGSLNPIYEMLESHSIVLTPHIVTIQDTFQGERSESGLMSTGVFNLGFCAIKRSDSAKKMISWWHERLLDKCFIDSYDTYFTDQKWMDFLPCYFDSDELYISRHLGMNIAPWNFFEREIYSEKECLKVRNREASSLDGDYQVIFVHYSGYNYTEMKRGNVIQNNISKIKNYEDIKLLTNIYANAISNKSGIFDKFIREKYSFGTFENGDIIKGFHRRIYRSLVNKGLIFDNPFSVAGDSLYQKLKTKGMTKTSAINIDKATKENLQGVGKKLKIFNTATRWLYKLVGLDRYLLLIRLMRSFSRFETQIHLLTSDFDEENISY
ncbi:glycosyltransferase [Flavobacterium pectinovorum]|uniref:Glycosyl transferase family 8 n=1 Tax=Flavobacterium pectinovorum TaxID=29533 RepID=A0AB36P5Z4_9FLAO|nr:glycosyltransferase [Flavobacterium pectinovorum]OXB07596.1 hypothetical protein B0A72_01655 [Flavobacterium pectinovorum]SHM73456.1 Glycosyl transferase family 8 [Flavobacterium pectinovorum]